MESGTFILSIKLYCYCQHFSLFRQVLDLENSIRQQHDELENYKTENVDLNKQMTQFVMEKAGKSRDSVIVDLNQQVEKLQKQIECIGKEKTEIQADKELYMTT